MDSEQVTARIAAYLLDRRHDAYLHKRNPVHAWAAYHTACTLHVEVPAWVRDVFDEWATELTTTTHHSAKGLADALKIGTKGGPLVTENAASEMRDLEIVAEVLDLLDHPTRRAEMLALAKSHGVTVDDIDTINDGAIDDHVTLIMDDVAGRHGLDYSSVSKIYYKWTRRPKTRRPKSSVT